MEGKKRRIYISTNPILDGDENRTPSCFITSVCRFLMPDDKIVHAPKSIPCTQIDHVLSISVLLPHHVMRTTGLALCVPVNLSFLQIPSYLATSSSAC